LESRIRAEKEGSMRGGREGEADREVFNKIGGIKYYVFIVKLNTRLKYKKKNKLYNI